MPALLILICAVFSGGAAGLHAERNRPPVINVWVNDQQVPVIEHWVGGQLNCTYAPLTLPGSADVEVEVPGGVRHWTVSPQKCEIPVTLEGGRLKFSMLTSKYMVVAVNGMRLLLLADPPEDGLPDEKKLLDVSAAPYNLDRSGAKDCTTVLQKACDDAGTLGNGAIVVLPPGLYTTTGIHLRSRTQLYLAPGAVLQANDVPEAYDECPLSPGTTRTAALIRLDGVEHVRIFGRGTIDARGQALAGDPAAREESRLLASCIEAQMSHCLSIDGVICKETTAVALNISESHDIAIRRIKVINDLSSSDCVDGIRISASQRALVEDCLVHTTEDAYAVTGGEAAPTEQVVMRRLVAVTSARALRCGPLAHNGMERIRFEDVDIVQARDALVLMHGEGKGDWRDITFRDIRVENCGRNNLAIHLLGGGSIRDIRFEDVHFAQSRPGFLRGWNDDSRIQSITFAGLEIEGRPAQNAASAGLRVGDFVDDIRFDN
ncbi:MAG: glycosyl hydrolase family 28 protein [Verrucomicrobium sp.]